jgi:Outer membrane protein beta-barrel domain
MMRSSLAILLLGFAASASAEDFSYNYLYLGYGTLDVDDVNVDGDGFGIGGSFAISDMFHVFANYQAADLNFNVDATIWNAGLGYHRGISPTMDLVASVSYEYVELDAPGFGNVDDSGLGLGVGLRYAAGEKLEFNGGIDYVDLSDSGNDTSLSLGALYDFSDAFSVGVSGSWGDDFSSYMLTGRFYFGN